MKIPLIFGAVALLTGTCRAATVDISIANFAFGASNATVTVTAGDTVRWTNNDTDPHTVTSGANRTADGKFDSGNLDPGGVYTHTFTATGAYPYFCAYHVGMESTIQVNPVTTEIIIKGFRFGNNNAQVTINAGEAIKWTNQDTGVTHTVTSGTRNTTDAGKLFDTPVPTGQSFTYTFTEPGTYPYFCRPHTSMNSSILVNPVTPPGLRGDVNGDGTVNGTDVLMGMRIVAGLDSVPSGKMSLLDVAPTAGDGVFDLLDILRIERYVTQLDTTPL